MTASMRGGFEYAAETLYERLKAKEIPDKEQFIKLVGAVFEEARDAALADVEHKLASKEFVRAECASLKAEITATRAELELKIETIKNELELKIETIKNELELKIEGIRAELKQALADHKADVIKWTLSTQIACAGLIITAMKLL